MLIRPQFSTGPLLLELSYVFEALQSNDPNAGVFTTRPGESSSPLLFLSLVLDENKEYFLELQKMIEDMAEKAGGPVVLIAHSMGNMYTLYFLNQQPQAWKDRYIKAFISLGPPWAGVAKTLRVLISGKRWNWYYVSSFSVCYVVGLSLHYIRSTSSQKSPEEKNITCTLKKFLETKEKQTKRCVSMK